MNNKGQVFVISGPSGSGKSCIAKRLSDLPSVHLAVSATTRKPRQGEIDGRDYHFITKDEFEDRIKQNKILEYNCYCDNYYGTPIEEITFCISGGKDVILEIDVNGANQVKEKMDVVKIFVIPPSIEELKNRLRGRGSEEGEIISRRVGEAKREIEEAFSYDYIIINEDLDKAVKEVVHIMDAEKQKVKNKKQFLTEVLKNGKINI